MFKFFSWLVESLVMNSLRNIYGKEIKMRLNDFNGLNINRMVTCFFGIKFSRQLIIVENRKYFNKRFCWRVNDFIMRYFVI